MGKLILHTTFDEELISSLPDGYSGRVEGKWQKEVACSLEMQDDLLVITSTSSANSRYGLVYDITLKANTQYTLWVLRGESFYVGFGPAAWPGGVANQSTESGVFKYTFTTGASVLQYRIYLYSNSVTGYVNRLNGIRLEEGGGTSMTDFTPGRNLIGEFNKVSTTNAEYDASSGRFVDKTTSNVKDGSPYIQAYNNGSYVSLLAGGSLKLGEQYLTFTKAANFNAIQFKLNNTYQDSSVRWTLLPDIEDGTKLTLSWNTVQLSPTGTGADVIIEGLTLHYGTEAAPWRPAPEDDDYDSLISEGGWNR